MSVNSGVLLYGPRALAKDAGQRACNESGVNFILVNGPEVFTKWLGESEEAIREVFRLARQVAPCQLFFDQLDAIAPLRGAHEGSMMTDRVVSQLLAQLDLLEPTAQISLRARPTVWSWLIRRWSAPAGSGTSCMFPCRTRPRGTRFGDGARHSDARDEPAFRRHRHAVRHAIENCSGAEIADLCERAKLAAANAGLSGTRASAAG